MLLNLIKSLKRRNTQKLSNFFNSSIWQTNFFFIFSMCAPFFPYPFEDLEVNAIVHTHSKYSVYVANTNLPYVEFTGHRVTMVIVICFFVIFCLTKMFHHKTFFHRIYIIQPYVKICKHFKQLPFQ